MDIGLLVPIFGVGIPLVAVTGRMIVKPYLALRHRQLDLEAAMIAEKAAQYASGSTQLEQRMRVLERIVTEKGMDLSDEIERLRDPLPHPSASHPSVQLAQSRNVP